jgi:O-antigen/teichoic acid export membrane protein
MWPRWVRILSTLWVAFDSKKRKELDVLWVILILLLGPLLLPIYMATRPLLKGEKRPNCFFWNLLVAIENFVLWCASLATLAVFVENLTLPKSKDIAEVKRAEIKAGTLMGMVIFVILMGLEKIGFETLKNHIETKYFEL